MNYRQSLYFVILLLSLIKWADVSAETLSCSITTAAACTGGTNTVILRMSGTFNAHAELPSQANANYAANVVCCSGITGLSYACTAPSAVVLRLAGATNAHSEQNSQTNANYTSNACISVPSGGTVSVGYVASPTTCSGASYEATLASMKAITNSHVGDTTAYTEYKICGTATGAAAQSLTFSVTPNSIGFGTLLSTGPRFANTTGGSGTEVEAHTLSASTNATGGYIITVRGATLTHTSNSSFTINAIGGTNTASAPGNEQFGLRATTAGPGTVTAPYAAAGFAYAATASTASQVASGAGDSASTIYSARYIANISGATEPGSYSATLTYVATATF